MSTPDPQQVAAMLAEMDAAVVRARELMTMEEWREYFFMLEGPDGCNFQDTPTWTWTCAGGTDQSLSKAILEKMGLSEIGVDEVLQCVSSLGGHCDCEVLFNAAERIGP